MGHKTFADMLEAIKQHHAGLVTDAELILVFQCDEFQLSALHQFNSLPLDVANKVGLVDFDASVDAARAKARSI